MTQKIVKKNMLCVVALVVMLSLVLSYSKRFDLKAFADLPIANEVVYDASSTRSVAEASEFIEAYKDEAVSRIILETNIYFDRYGSADLLRAVRRVHSLQIDGNGHTFVNTARDTYNDGSTFSLGTLSGGSSTFHLKNLNIRTRGTNFVDAVNAERSQGWQIILEHTTLGFKNEDGYYDDNTLNDQPRRVVRAPLADLYLRTNVEMRTTGENAIIGSVTVEPKTNVRGVTTHFDSSNWWMRNAKGTGLVHIGEGSSVGLTGKGGTYPVIYQYWREINVHKDAILKGYKPGRVYASGPLSHSINVRQGATFSGQNDGVASLFPVMEMKRENFYAGPKSIVSLIGTTTNDSIPVLSMGENEPRLYGVSIASFDVRNNRTTGKAVVIKTGMLSLRGNIQAWVSGVQRNLDATPDNDWYHATIDATADDNAIISVNGWRIHAYARISTWYSNDVY